ncbi:hypothetical protein BC829DRAFT_408727 [Chytridium lagenaria]|nr:hypothetical protein BC829DRAFT_408727 [Chytridium lagenaria]
MDRLMTFASNTILPNSPTPPMDPLAHPQRSTSLISLSQTNSIVSSPQLIEPITIPNEAIVILRRRSSLVNRLSSATLDIGNGLLNDLQTADMSSNVNGREVDAESDRGNTLAVVKIDIVDKQPDITEKESNIVALQGRVCALLTSIPDTKAIEIAKVIDSPSLSPANSLLSPQPLPTTLQSQKVFHTIHVVTVTPSSTSCQIKDTPIDHNDANSTAAQLQTLPSKTEPITSLKSVTSLSSPIKLSTAASTTITIMKKCGLIFKSWIVEKKQRMLP